MPDAGEPVVVRGAAYSCCAVHHTNQKLSDHAPRATRLAVARGRLFVETALHGRAGVVIWPLRATPSAVRFPPEATKT